MPLTALINKLEKLPQVIESAMQEAVEQSENALVELQKDRMDMGLDINGNPIEYNKPRKSPLNETGAYTRKYAKQKQKWGGKTRVVDLEGKTGEYKRKMKSKTTRGNNEVDVDIVSDAPHSIFIEKNYDDIYGLDSRQQKEIEADISKKIEQKIDNFLRL